MIKKQVIFYQGVIEPVLVIPVPTVDMWESLIYHIPRRKKSQVLRDRSVPFIEPSLYPQNLDWEIPTFPPRKAKPQSLRDRTVHFIAPSVYPFTFDWEFHNKPPRRNKPWPPASHMNRFQRSSGLNLDAIEAVELKSYAIRNPIPYNKGNTQVGQYITSYQASATAGTLTKLRIYYMPIVIPYAIHVSELSIYITTRDDDTQSRIGIFASERGIITELIYSNIVQNNTTGLRGVGADIQLTKGIFFVAIVVDSDILKVRKATIVFESTLLPHNSPDEVTSNTHYYNDISSFSDGFSDNPTVILSSGNVPSVWLRT